MSRLEEMIWVSVEYVKKNNIDKCQVLTYRNDVGYCRLGEYIRIQDANHNQKLQV